MKRAGYGTLLKLFDDAFVVLVRSFFSDLLSDGDGLVVFGYENNRLPL